MAVHGQVGDPLYFDTENNLRFLAIPIYLDVSYAVLVATESQAIQIEPTDFYVSALLGYKRDTTTFYCPLAVDSSTYIKIKGSNNVYISRILYRGLAIKNTDSGGTTISIMSRSTELTPPFDAALYAQIFITTDNKWMFYFGYTYGNNTAPQYRNTIIFPSASGFGAIDAVHETIEMNTATIALQSSLEIGEALKGADIDIDDPYSSGGDTEDDGGTGDFDNTSDDIDFPGLPTLSAVDTGFIRLYNPSLTELQSLASYMWSNLFDESTLKKLFADPMNCILGLSVVPVSVPSGISIPVTVGNISTGVSMTTASSQYVTVDCGMLNVNEYWGAYLDYSPYTKAEIYLPYCGIHPISIDDIMGKSVSVKYNVDILSGACCAMVKCGGSVLYSFIGQCAASIPISGNDWSTVINGVISAATAVGSMVATGGASAPLTLPALASTAANSMKPSVERSGAMGGTGGMMGVQTPYIILTRPRQALPKSQNKYTGYPSFITENIGELTGYTEVELIHLENVPATSSELNEIETILKSGVIL